MKFDSATKALNFSNVYNVDGKLLFSASQSIDLSRFDERTRQYMILIAKVTIGFANGHDLDVKAVERFKTFTRENKGSSAVETVTAQPDQLATDQPMTEEGAVLTVNDAGAERE